MCTEKRWQLSNKFDSRATKTLLILLTLSIGSISARADFMFSQVSSPMICLNLLPEAAYMLQVLRKTSELNTDDLNHPSRWLQVP